MKIFISKKCINCSDDIKTKYNSLPVSNFPNLQELIFINKCKFCLARERKIKKLKEKLLNIEYELHCLEDDDERIYN
jgi:hypothetical protein